MVNIEGLKEKVSKSGFEVRTFKSGEELRAASFIDSEKNEEGENKSSPKIEGYASVVDLPSDNLGGFIELIARGAFDETDFSNCKALWNHNDDIVLGSVSANTLSLTVNERGLFYSVEPPDNDYINDLVISCLRRGDVDKSSFRFFVADDEWTYDDATDICYRKITKISEVLDVSPVTFPAYSYSSSALRSLTEACNMSDSDAIKQKLLRDNFLNSTF